jgi:hypothetical protein
MIDFCLGFKPIALEDEMRVLLIALACVLAQVALWAQPVLNRDNFGQIGDVIEFKNANTDGIQPGPAGANQSWDFSMLTPNGNDDPPLTFKDPSQTNSFSHFPEATLVLEEISEGNVNLSFYKANASEFTLLGIVGAEDNPNELIVVYDDTSRVLTFPFGYGDRVEDTFSAQYTSQGVAISRTGFTISEADGYGSLNIPGASFSNTLRFKTVQDITDTFAGISTHTITTSYSWVAPGNHWPVLIYNHIEYTILGQTETTIQIEYQGEAGPQEPSTRQISHLTKPGAGFETTLFVRNSGNEPSEVTLTPFLSNGQAAMEQTLTIPGKGFRTYDPTELFAGATDVSHIEASFEGAINLSTAYKVEGLIGASAHLHAEDEGNTRFRFYPGEWDTIFDGMALVNQGNGMASVSARQVDFSGEVIDEVQLKNDLSPKEKFLAVFASTFDDLPGTAIEIECSEPATVVLLRGTPLGTEPAYLYATSPQSDPGLNRWIPHITAPTGGFVTTIFLENEANLSQTVQFQPYDATGTPLSPVAVSLQPRETKALVQSELFPESSTSHAKIVNTNSVRITTAFKAASGPGATAHVPERTLTSRSYWIYPGEWDVIFDGVALVNVGDQSATITANYVNQEGQTIATASIASNLAPKGKALAVFGNLFPGQTQGIIEISSSQEMAPVFLRGSYLSSDPSVTTPSYLYSNLPLP